METTHSPRRPSNLFEHRLLAATLLVLALIGLVVSPAAALLPGVGIVRPGGAVDPCLSGPQVSFGPPSQSIGFGANATLSWSVQVPSGCGYSLSMTVLARPQINLSPGAPQDWAIWTSSTAVAAQPQGSLVVQPAFNTVYMLVVALGSNSAIYSTPIQVAVNLPLANLVCPDVVNVTTVSLMTVTNAGPSTGVAPASPQPCPRRVTINANNLAPLLVQALGTPNTTVIVRNGVELDLTPHLGNPLDGGVIHIADGVQLIGERVAEPGKPFQPGPRLYVTPNPYAFDSSHWPDPLFQIDGSHVRIGGVRIEGPGAPPDAWRTIPQGYTIAIEFSEQTCKDKPPMDPAACSGPGSTPTPAGTAAINIEIDHNEFSGWNTAAVQVWGPGDINFGDELAGQVWQGWTIRATSDSSGIHYPLDPEPIRIHDNHFHDNFWGTPYEGYGVNVGLGGHALIERNVFDWHFHAITTDGNFGSGYRAYSNLVFRNQEQNFDMHGRRCPHLTNGKLDYSCPPGTPDAHDIDIRWNSFSLPQVPAVKLMGSPELQPYGAVVQSNVFAHVSIGPTDLSCHIGQSYGPDAVVICGNGLLIGPDNLLGVRSWGDPADPVHHFGSCDFDGDGINDDFMTTGQTWWYRSGNQSNGPTPWVFLNTNMRLVTDAVLGYFSTDAIRNHVCDVVTPDGLYKGGTGVPGGLN